jgi:hypothetical protein
MLPSCPRDFSTRVRETFCPNTEIPSHCGLGFTIRHLHFVTVLPMLEAERCGGVLYGTTESGGSGACSATGAGGCGAVFSLSPPTFPGGDGNEAVLYSFDTNGFCSNGDISPTILTTSTGSPSSGRFAFSNLRLTVWYSSARKFRIPCCGRSSCRL